MDKSHAQFSIKYNLSNGVYVYMTCFVGEHPKDDQTMIELGPNTLPRETFYGLHENNELKGALLDFRKESDKFKKANRQKVVEPFLS